MVAGFINKLKNKVRGVKKSLTPHFEEKELYRVLNQRVLVDWFETDAILDKLTILYFYFSDVESREIEISLTKLYIWGVNNDLVHFTYDWFDYGVDEFGNQDGRRQQIRDYEGFIE